jgi:flagellar hook-length control protein FliK
MNPTNLEILAASSANKGIALSTKSLEKDEMVSLNAGTSPFAEILDKKIARNNPPVSKTSSANSTTKKLKDSPAITGWDITRGNAQGVQLENTNKEGKQIDQQKVGTQPLQEECLQKTAMGQIAGNSEVPASDAMNTIFLEVLAFSHSQSDHENPSTQEEGLAEQVLTLISPQTETGVPTIQVIPAQLTEKEISTIEAGNTPLTDELSGSSVVMQNITPHERELFDSLTTAISHSEDVYSEISQNQAGAPLGILDKASDISPRAFTTTINTQAELKSDLSDENKAEKMNGHHTARPVQSLGISNKDLAREQGEDSRKIETSPLSVEIGVREKNSRIEMPSASSQADTILPENARSIVDSLTDQTPVVRHEHQKESAFISRITEMMNQKDKAGTVNDISSDIRQVVISQEDKKVQSTQGTERAFITEIQKHVSSPRTIHKEGEARPKQNIPEPSILPGAFEEVVTAKYTEATAALSSLSEKGESVHKVLSRQIRNSEREPFPFRMEMANISTPQTSGPSMPDGSPALNMQSVVDHILDLKQSMNNDCSRVRIVLDPPNLGSVDLDILVRRERVEIVMTTENASVQQALQSRSDDIRTALFRQDLKIDTIQVVLQDHGADQQQAHGGAMFDQRQKRQSRQEAGNEAPALHPLPSLSGMDRMNGRLSFFV